MTTSEEVTPSVSPLREVLEAAIADGSAKSMKDLTVLTNDPFRLDTPANHLFGQWLATTAQTLGLGDRKIHNRGLHYMILGQPKPDGTPYVSDEASWALLEDASKAARWLGYIPFDQITDQRNAAPVVRIFEHHDPWPYLHVGVHVEIPEVADIRPAANLLGFTGIQPYRLVLVGEKSSLEPQLAPIAETFKADLFLPTGDISDTLIYQMAKAGAEDGRPMRVVYFADADPSGWNMGVVVGRKLQALKVLHFPGLDFEVHRAGLTPDQVRRFDLPSTPLKPTEKRAGEWFAAFGVEQTEIDALATLRPELLRQIAREAVDPFFDRTLVQRVEDARQVWIRQAQQVVDNSVDQDALGRLRGQAEAKLTELRAEIDAINDALRLDITDFDVPPVPAVPEPALNGDQPKGLLDSRWSFVEQCRALLDSKAYRLNGGGADG